MNTETIDITIEDLTPSDALRGCAVWIGEGGHPAGDIPAGTDRTLFADALAVAYPAVAFESWNDHNLAVRGNHVTDVTDLILWDVFTSATNTELAQFIEDWS